LAKQQAILSAKETGMKSWLMVLVALGLVFGLWASAEVSAQDDVTKHPSCPYCGMDRAKFAYSRVLVEYDDGSAFGACSLHCAAIDLAVHMDKSPKSVLVGDYHTRQLIDAEKATWVIGGKKMGVMTQTAKWAFASKAEAEKFVQEEGGQIATFDEALKAAYDGMYQDSKMIREKRKEKHMKAPQGG
jgi:copper chaperone NosL